MDQPSIERAMISLLRRVLEGELVSEGELVELASADFTPRAGRAWHQLMHWVTDADIRARDPGYASTHLALLRQEMKALDEG